MSVNLQYNYAKIDLATGRCKSCFTCSYEINDPEYIAIPTTGDYTDKYYNAADGMWYWDAAFTQLWEECPSHAE